MVGTCPIGCVIAILQYNGRLKIINPIIITAKIIIRPANTLSSNFIFFLVNYLLNKTIKAAIKAIKLAR